MKEFLQRSPLLMILLACAVSLCCTTVAWADEGDYIVEYKGEAEGLVTIEDDFFAHFPELLPGDVVDGNVKILNSSETEQEIFFYTEPTDPSGNEKADDLLYLLDLKITSMSTGETLYDGIIHADTLNEPISLGVFDEGEGDTLHFEVSVPVSIGEEYASLGNQVHWVFAVEGKVSGQKSGHSLGQTGDAFGEVVPLLLLVTTIGVSALIVAAKRNAADRERG